jgi:hypothetical protein
MAYEIDIYFGCNNSSRFGEDKGPKPPPPLFRLIFFKMMVVKLPNLAPKMAEILDIQRSPPPHLSKILDPPLN